MPPPPQVAAAIPGFFMGSMMMLALIDLSVDMSGDPAFVAAWYQMQPDMPMLRRIPVVLLPLLVLLLLKTFGVSVPGALKGRPGFAWGCTPLVLLPVVIALTVIAKRISSAGNFDEATLKELTTLHLTKLVLLPLMPICMLREQFLVAKAAAKEKES